MSPLPIKYHAPLLFACEKLTESKDQAELLSEKYKTYFLNLGKYDQMQALLNLDINHNGIEEELKNII